MKKSIILSVGLLALVGSQAHGWSIWDYLPKWAGGESNWIENWQDQVLPEFLGGTPQEYVDQKRDAYQEKRSIESEFGSLKSPYGQRYYVPPEKALNKASKKHIDVVQKMEKEISDFKKRYPYAVDKLEMLEKDRKKKSDFAIDLMMGTQDEINRDHNASEAIKKKWKDIAMKRYYQREKALIDDHIRDIKNLAEDQRYRLQKKKKRQELEEYEYPQVEGELETEESIWAYEQQKELQESLEREEEARKKKLEEQVLDYWETQY